MRQTDVSIIVSFEDFGGDLSGLLRSVARQTEPLDRVQVVVAGRPDRMGAGPGVWRDMADGAEVLIVETGPEATVPQALNAGAEAATGGLLSFPRAGVRFDPHFLRSLADLFSGDTDVCYADYIRLSDNPQLAGVVRLPDFDHRMLQVADYLGPCLTLRREAWDGTGFQDNTLYYHWDFRVRLAAKGLSFARIDYPLTTADHHKPNFRERAEDGRAKAMVVINNQGYFHQHTVRWALSYLRGADWAEVGPLGVIPSPMEVVRLTHHDAVRRMGATTITERAVRQFENCAVSNE